jgi:hypothetical protein
VVCSVSQTDRVATCDQSHVWSAQEAFLLFPSVNFENDCSEAKLGRLREIGSDRDTIGADLTTSFADGLRTVSGDDDFSSFLDELFRGCETDPANAAGDDDNLVREAALGSVRLSVSTPNQLTNRA